MIGVPRIEGISWLRLFESVLAAQAQVWGGSANLLFPLETDLASNELLWELARRQDADSWTVHAFTVGDMDWLDPKWSARRRENLRHRLNDQPSQAIEDFLEHDRETAFDLDQPKQDWWQSVVKRLAPLHHEGGEPLEWMTSGPPQWPAVDVAKFRDLPRKVVNPVTPTSSVLRLLLTTEIGRFNAGFSETLRTQDVDVATPRLQTPFQVATMLFETRGSDVAFPWTLSEHGLAFYRRGIDGESPVVIVAGDRPLDFTLFYALRRWTSLAYWLPTWLSRNPIVSNQLLDAAIRWASQSSRQVAVVTTSSNQRFRDEVASRLRARARPKDKIVACDWREVLPDRPNRLFEEGNFGVPRERVPLEAGATTELPTPMPRRVSTEDPSDLRWFTEIDVKDWAPLQHPAVSQAVLHAYGRPELQRATTTGLAYFCPREWFRRGDTLESIAIRPSLTPLSLVGQLRAIVEPEGWSCAPSDKGVYADETIALFGGRQELCNGLRRRSIRALLDAFVTASAGRDVGGGRRALTRRHVDEVVGDEGPHVLHELVELQVLSRGLVLKCGRCRQTAWYSLDDAGSWFTCARCRLEQRLDDRTAGTEEPPWFYGLAEVVHQFMAHHGEIPILAADGAFKDAKDPVDYAVELEFARNGKPGAPNFEIDIVASVGPDLWVGEAARNLRPDAGRLKQLKRFAEAVEARGIIFATSRAQFSSEAAARIQATFDKTQIEVRLLESTGIPSAA